MTTSSPRPTRRRSSSLPPPVGKGKKKALLIGINYDSHAGGSEAETGYYKLKTCRKDAFDFRDLLIRRFGYRNEDITVMTDELDSGRLAPTQANVIREIRDLVKGAQPGDRFVFLFAGHSGQIVSDSHSEDDGMDETIVLVDEHGAPSDQHIIVDNHLRRLLVDPLPIGAHLTAIFDSCHSGTLLDLKHYTCNQIYLPWISKGLRRSRSRWGQVLRRDAVIDESGIPSPGVRIHQRHRVSGHDVLSKDISLAIQPTSVQSGRATVTVTSRTASLLSQRSMSLTHMEDASIAQVLERVSSKLHAGWNGKHEDEDIPSCLSPVESISSWAEEKVVEERIANHALSYDRFVDSPVSTNCTGFCVASPSDANKPHVISLSACKDTQITYEDKKGNSITRALVDILNDPQSHTFRELMTRISDRIYNKSRRVHRIGLRRHELKKADLKLGHRARAATDPTEAEKPKLSLDVVNFQEPQLGSEKKLDLDACFML